MDTFILMYSFTLLTVIVIPASVRAVPRQRSDEEILLHDLFTFYNPSARPVIDSSQTVNVAIQFSLMHIKELDVRSQVFTTTGLLILEWTDERLVWDPYNYGNVSDLIVEADKLWRPEFAVINGAEKIYENYSNFRAIVTHKGNIHWEPGGVFKTMCPIDITYYPFDMQQCTLLFGAWSYHTSKMNLTNTKDTINNDSYSTNGEWEIVHHQAERDEFAYDCCPNERFAYVGFRVSIRRRHMFYILNVILPSILTSVLLLSIFFCTPGQKVQIGVVVLLSFRIFLLNVSDNIPKTSDHVPLLGIYLTCTMAITTLSMVLTVFILNLHHIADRPVPPWVSRLVLVYTARIVGKCSPSDVTPKPKLFCLKKKSAQDKVNPTETTVACDSNGDVDEGPFGQRLPPTHNSEDKPSNDISNSITVESDIAIDKNRSADFSKDWRQVAEVFDRLFFWLFLLAILISTLVLFHPLTDAYIRNLLLL